MVLSISMNVFGWILLNKIKHYGRINMERTAMILRRIRVWRSKCYLEPLHEKFECERKKCRHEGKGKSVDSMVSSLP